jgi:antitoxin VapB
MLAKLFLNGRSQAVRLPREFRFSGEQVRIRRVEGGVLLEPVISDPREWFATMDRLNEGFMSPKDRNQPKAPRRKLFE